MTVLILCGGEGLRIKGHFNNIPKPLININGYPLISYIIKQYAQFDINHFILLIGNNEELYRDYAKLNSNSVVKIEVLQSGKNTPTGGRIKQAEKIVKSENFFLTYGDGIAAIDFQKELQFHLHHNKTATLTAVKPQLPFGLLKLSKGGDVQSFLEKPILEQYINGGFFVLNKNIYHYLNESSDFEKEILPQLAKENQLKAYLHTGFWKNMDTLKDYLQLEKLEIKKILY